MSQIDKIITVLDKSLKALTYRPKTKFIEPKCDISIRCMRVNYAGEIAAQGLYLGAALVEKTPEDGFYFEAAKEEFQHLQWCGERVVTKGGNVSYFNPVWFLGGFCLGVASRVAGSQYALGFVQETEHQVLRHLKKHLALLPADDHRSRAVVEQMIIDEESHGQEAFLKGAKELPWQVKLLMEKMGKILTGVSEVI